MKWYINSCDGIYNSFDVHFTSECDNRCPHCIDAKYDGKGFKRPNAHAIAKTIIEHQEGFDDVLFLGGEPCLYHVAEYYKAVGVELACCCLQAYGKDFIFTQDEVKEIIEKED